MKPITASVAVIGGSGLYRLFDPATSTVQRVETPYGPAEVTIGELGGRTVAFLTRHGTDHSVAPHLINYRANIWALASLGVTAILSSAAVGGVHPDFPPGTLVLTDQFIDRTYGRADTFYDRGSVQHLAAADPFCPTLHAVAAAALDAAGESVAPSGTVVVIQGPRFSTRAESLWFRAAGAHTVNMTLYPEVPLAAELNIGTVNLSFVTDSDAGLAPAARVGGAAGGGADAGTGGGADAGHPASDEPAEELSAELVFARLAAAQPRIIAAIETIIRALPADYSPRALIAPAEVAAVLSRDVVADGDTVAPVTAAGAAS
ncbi:5'-methylthioadenosine phosphorylase [Marisediminicola sp. UYEF4]|uniref:MTAP family purine nucleoside phosphorylase n=1 Tax=Marisediminicola sp. UYEF4 TaxID=1756384 RepID=UPI0033988DFA